MAMSHPCRYADYDQIAQSYDRRYERNEYAGVEQALRQFIGEQPGLRILEAGCGTGHWLKTLQESKNYVAGLDFSSEMLDRAQTVAPESALIRGRAEHLPWTAGSFDRVFCINAIHHFSDKPAFLAQIRRVLRPGGKFLTVGLDPHRGIDQWHVYDYFEESLEIDRQRYPACDRLMEWMYEAGFENCITQEVEHWIYRIPAREALAQGRLDKAATSQLSVLTDEEYQQGMQRLHTDIQRAEEKGQTLFLTADLRLYGTTACVAGCEHG
jgi:ubiquinone/menaquinone biosynthesis C-methylase UbiE